MVIRRKRMSTCSTTHKKVPPRRRMNILCEKKQQQTADVSPSPRQKINEDVTFLSALVGWLTGWGWYTRFSRWKLYSFTYLLLARFPADPLDWKQKLWLGSGPRAKKAFDYKLNLNWTLTLQMRKAATIKFRGHSEQSIWFCWRHSFYSPSNIR